MSEYIKAEVAEIRMVKSYFKSNRAGGDEDFISNDDASLSSTRAGGGAISFEGQPGRLICEDSTFYNNSGASGGAILLGNVEFLKLVRSTFTDHEAILGGALAVLNTNIKMELSEVMFTTNKAIRGGAVYLERLRRVGKDDALEQKRLLKSTVFPDSVIEFKRVTFLGNWAFLEGGAVDVLGLVLSFSDCKFTSNSAVEGGGLRITDAAAVVLTNTIMKSCRAEHGGAIHIEDGLLLGIKSAWIENHALHTGSAIDGEYSAASSIGNAASVELIDCNFTRNSVGHAGNPIFLYHSNATSCAHDFSQRFFPVCFLLLGVRELNGFSCLVLCFGRDSTHC